MADIQAHHIAHTLPRSLTRQEAMMATTLAVTVPLTRVVTTRIRRLATTIGTGNTEHPNRDFALKDNTEKLTSNLRSDLHTCISIYEEELQRRYASTHAGIGGLAPDTSLISDYLTPTAENKISVAAVEALLQSRNLKIFLLPEVVYELSRIFQSLQDSPGASFYRGVNEYSRSLNEEHILSKLKTDLRNHYFRLSEAHLRINRLAYLFSHLSGRQNNWADVAESGKPLEDDIEETFNQLSMKSRRLGRFRDYLTATKIGTILSLARNDIFIPLVSQSHVVHSVCNHETLLRRKPKGATLCVKAFSAIVMLSLANATTKDVVSFHDTAKSLLIQLDVSPHQDAFLGLRAKAEFKELLETTYKLARISSLLHQTWTPPIRDLPPELDLQRLAGAVLELNENLLATLRYNTELGLKLGVQQNQEDTLGIEANRDILKVIAQSDGKVIIQQLTVIEKGGLLNQYNIKQTGSNLTAIVDSFKTTVNDSPAGTSEHLNTLVEAVLASHLSDQDKHDVVESATEVVQSVKKEGHLKGKGALLWNGIKEAVKTVPAAIEAWNALSKLW
jgi:hypothetical protein